METVLLADNRKTIDTTLPTTGGVVIMFTSLLFGDTDEIDPSKEIESGKKMLLKLIKSWNFVDAAKKPMPIDEKSLKLLPVEDVSHLISTMTEMISAQNKKKGS